MAELTLGMPAVSRAIRAGRFVEALDLLIVMLGDARQAAAALAALLATEPRPL